MIEVNRHVGWLIVEVQGRNTFSLLSLVVGLVGLVGYVALLSLSLVIVPGIVLGSLFYFCLFLCLVIIHSNSFANHLPIYFLIVIHVFSYV